MADHSQPDTPDGGKASLAFISYASEDKSAAETVCQALEGGGVACWIAPRDVAPGASYASEIVRGIDMSTVMVLLLSAHAASSPHVLRELERCTSKRHPAIAVRLDQAPLPADFEYFLNSSHWLDAHEGGVESILRRLIEAVVRLRGAAGAVLPTAAPFATRPSKKVHRVVLIVIAVVTLLAGAIAHFVGKPSSRSTLANGVSKAQEKADQKATNSLSIIVLPLVNQTGDPQKGYIADGITASISSDLTRIEQAYVVPGPTAYAYKDKALSVRQVAAETQVRFVLSGNVQGTGTHMRVNVELFDGPSERQLWNRVFDGKDADLLALQDRVTTQVGNSLGREMVIAAARDTESLAAHPESSDLLLQARAIELGSESAEKFRATEGIYRNLLQREPDNGTVLTGLAYTLISAAGLGFYSPHTIAKKTEMIAESQSLAERARRLGYRSPSLGYVLGWDALFRGDFQSAKHEFQAVADQRPKSAYSFNSLGCLAYAEFEPNRALDYFKQATEVESGEARDFILLNMSIAYLQLKDYPSAIDSVERALVASPQFEIGIALAALAHSLNGDEAEADKWAHKAKHSQVTMADVTGIPKGSPRYEQWMQTVILPAWRKLGFEE
jgi:adenylate cyclase